MLLRINYRSLTHILKFSSLFDVKQLPIMTPDIIVALKGVRVLSLIVDKKLNNKPSLDIAYKIRGNGIKHTNKLYTITFFFKFHLNW